MKIEVYFLANQEFNISDFEKYLEIAKTKGADCFKVESSGDPMWRYEWIRFYKTLSDEDIKQEKIKKLEIELQKLKP